MSTKHAYDGGIKHRPFHGKYRIGTKYRYSSGAGHYAYDYLTPMGTRLYAVRNGVILDCHDGEPDNAPKRWSGMPSNWILLGYTNKAGKKRTVYYQHLKKGSIRVQKGDKVKAGKWIAQSGNSGNSTGPHLHIHVMKGWRTRAQRYWNYKSAYRIYPPSLTWAKDTL